MPYYCTVPRCTSMAGKVKNVSFHQFPRDEELAKVWNDILKRGKPYTKYSKVCSLHFKPEDYTITSVGKNKGQWRTLRKNAIPSQNLPSDAPMGTQRRQSEPWLPNTSPVLNIMDPMIHQQVAQAIYMQTMLAMQAVGTNTPNMETESDESQDKGDPPNSSSPLDTQPTHKHTNSYKCNHCTKFFKDPDVFLLHQRNHTQKALDSFEKENFNINTTLMVQANPILVNLLKKNESNIENTQNNDISFLNDFGSKMDQYIQLAVLAKSDSLLHNHNIISDKNDMVNNYSAVTDNVSDINDTINQSDKLLYMHKAVENVINFKINNENETNDDNNDMENEIYYDEIAKQTPKNYQKTNECIINNHDSLHPVSNHLTHNGVTNIELHSDRLLSYNSKKPDTNDVNTINTNFYFKSSVKNNEPLANNITDKVNERIQRLALLANTNYSLIGDDVERANLIFGNGKIIESVIDFKHNNRFIDNSVVNDRFELDSDDSDCVLNESIESNNLIIDESV